MILNVNTKPNSSGVPVFTYTGNYEIVDDNNNALTDLKAKNWRVRFLTSGELTITNLKGANNGIDIFLVGGGGGGAQNIAGSSKGSGCGGGGGGQTKMFSNVLLNKNTEYTITIGAGNKDGYNVSGGWSSAFGYTAEGGASAHPGSNYGGGNGGDGSYYMTSGGNGAKEFGIGPFYYGGGGGGGAQWATGTVYSPGAGGLGGGGAGGTAYTGTSSPIQSGQHGATNTGGGGGGAGGKRYDSPQLNGGRGGSGIVIIRNIRTEPLWEDVPFYGTVNVTGSLEVRNIPSYTTSGTKVNGTLANQKKVSIYDLSLDADPSETLIWGEIQDSAVSGWCNLSYFTINARGTINKKQGATIYSTASSEGTVVTILPLNTILTATQFVNGNNQIWAKISASYNGTNYNGYVLREHINFSGN